MPLNFTSIPNASSVLEFFLSYIDVKRNLIFIQSWTNSLKQFTDKVDYIVFYAVLAIFRPYNGGDYIVLINDNQLWNFEVSFAVLTSLLFMSSKSSERSFACHGGCYPWHGAPFNVPSDGHKWKFQIDFCKIQGQFDTALTWNTCNRILCRTENTVTEVSVPSLQKISREQNGAPVLWL